MPLTPGAWAVQKPALSPGFAPAPSPTWERATWGPSHLSIVHGAVLHVLNRKLHPIARQLQAAPTARQATLTAREASTRRQQHRAVHVLQPPPCRHARSACRVLPSVLASSLPAPTSKGCSYLSGFMGQSPEPRFERHLSDNGLSTLSRAVLPVCLQAIFADWVAVARWQQPWAVHILQAPVCRHAAAAYAALVDMWQD